MAIHTYSRVIWINCVRLPNLVEVSCFRGKYICMYWYSTAVCIDLYTRYIFYLGTCTFVHGSLLLYLCVFSSHSLWTSSSLDVPAGVTQEEGHTGFLIHLLSAVRALIFLARRIQAFLSLVDREVKLCVLAI